MRPGESQGIANGEQKAGLPPVPWDVPEALALLLASLLVQLPALWLLRLAPSAMASRLAVAAFSKAAVLGLIWWVVAVAGGRERPVYLLLGLRAPTWRRLRRGVKVLIAGAAAFAGMVLLVSAFWDILSEPGQQFPVQPLARRLAQARSPRVIALAVLVAVAVAPVTEEVLYRSVLYLPLRRRAGVTGAALTVALVFGLAHGYWWGVPNLVVLSLTLTALFEYTGTLWAPILAHSAYNAVMIAAVRALWLPG